MRDYRHLESVLICLTKKVGQLYVTFSFSTALNPTEILPPSACWKVLGKDKDVIAPVVTDSIIKDYQKAKYARTKGQYRKAYKMFSSRRTVSVKTQKDGNNPQYAYIKVKMLKSYSGNISRPVTIQFFENKHVKAYCNCPVGKSGLCCHAIALLIQLKFFSLPQKTPSLHDLYGESTEMACKGIHSKSKGCI